MSFKSSIYLYKSALSSPRDANAYKAAFNMVNCYLNEHGEEMKRCLGLSGDIFIE